MNKAVKKLITHLEVIYKSCINSLDTIDKLKEVQEQLLVTMNLIDTLKEESQEEKKCHEIFQDFNILSKYLLDSSLNSKECLQVITYLIEKNIASGFTLKNSIDIDGRDLLTYPFKTISTIEVARMFSTGEASQLLATKEEELTPIQRKQKREIILFIESNRVDTTELVQNTRIIENCYLRKKESYKEQDIHEMIKALRKIQIHPALCEKIQFVLEKEYRKRNQSINREEIQPQKKGRIKEEQLQKE